VSYQSSVGRSCRQTLTQVYTVSQSIAECSDYSGIEIRLPIFSTSDNCALGAELSNSRGCSTVKSPRSLLHDSLQLMGILLFTSSSGIWHFPSHLVQVSLCRLRNIGFTASRGRTFHSSFERFLDHDGLVHHATSRLSHVLSRRHWGVVGIMR
jgi:hypothetical protein